MPKRGHAPDAGGNAPGNVGLAAGIGLALLAARWAGALLFGLRPWDPLSFGIATGTLVTVALLAAWVPARRASRLAPTVALRD